MRLCWKLGTYQLTGSLSTVLKNGQNIAEWILELDRGEGIPHEGNYSKWLETKAKRFAEEKKQETANAKAIASELEWIRSNPKAKGNKSKARLSRYEALLAAAAPKELRNSGQIWIPPGPRLGDIVLDVNNVRKSFGDRLLIDNLTFSMPRSGILGVIGPNGAGKVRFLPYMLLLVFHALSAGHTDITLVLNVSNFKTATVDVDQNDSWTRTAGLWRNPLG